MLVRYTRPCKHYSQIQAHFVGTWWKHQPNRTYIHCTPAKKQSLLLLATTGVFDLLALACGLQRREKRHTAGSDHEHPALGALGKNIARIPNAPGVIARERACVCVQCREVRGRRQVHVKRWFTEQSTSFSPCVCMYVWTYGAKKLKVVPSGYKSVVQLWNSCRIALGKSCPDQFPQCLCKTRASMQYSPTNQPASLIINPRTDIHHIDAYKNNCGLFVLHNLFLRSSVQYMQAFSVHNANKWASELNHKSKLLSF